MSDTPNAVERALSLLVHAARISPPLRDAVATVENEIRSLRVLLAQANDAFDECTGDYPKELVADEPWRQYGGER